MIDLNLNYLPKLKVTSHISDDLISEYMQLYSAGCKCLEFLIKISFYVLQLSDDANYSFDIIRRTPVFSVKENLNKRNSEYNTLLEPFKTIIWNGIKHSAAIKNPKEKK